MREAVILAGGYGTRLYPLTQTRAKSLLPIAGVPLMHRLVKYLEKNGFEKIIVTLNNFSTQIKASLEGLDCSAELKFSEERIPLGTAGSVRNARRHISDAFLVVQGDSLTDINLGKAKEFHIGHRAMGTILLQQREDVTGLGVVDLDSRNNISRFVEKPTLSDDHSRLISTGIYFLEPIVLDHIPAKQPFDFAKDLFPLLLKKGRKIKGVPVDGYWIDIGTPKSYKEACKWFLRLVADHAPKYPDQLGRTFNSDQLINGRSDAWDSPSNSTSVGPSMIRAGCSIDKQATVDGSILESGVSVGKGAIVRDSIVMEGARIDGAAILESAIIGEGCHVGTGSNIGRESVLGGYVEIEPSVAVKENSIIPAKSVVNKHSTQWVYAQDDDVYCSPQV